MADIRAVLHGIAARSSRQPRRWTASGRTDDAPGRRERRRRRKAPEPGDGFVLRRHRRGREGDAGARRRRGRRRQPRRGGSLRASSAGGGFVRARLGAGQGRDAAAYAAANHLLATFEHDIQKFKDLAEEIRAETHTKHMLFLRVDCEPCGRGGAALRAVARALPRASQRPGTCRFVRALRVLRERSGRCARSPAALEQLADKVAMHRRFLTRAKRRTLRSRLFALGTRRWRSSSSAARRDELAKLAGWTRPGPRSRRCSARRRFRWRSTRRASGTS